MVIARESIADRMGILEHGALPRVGASTEAYDRPDSAVTLGVDPAAAHYFSDDGRTIARAER